jgi:hypothetical protein
MQEMTGKGVEGEGYTYRKDLDFQVMSIYVSQQQVK